MTIGSKWLAGAFLILGLANSAGVAYLLLREPVAEPVRSERSSDISRNSSAEAISTLADALRSRSTQLQPHEAPSVIDPPLDEDAASEQDSPPTQPEVGTLEVADVVDDVFEHERRDTSWANAVESRFRKEAESSPEVSIDRLECGSTRCGVRLRAPDVQVLERIPHWFGSGNLAFSGKRSEEGYAYEAVYVRDGHDMYGNELVL